MSDLSASGLAPAVSQADGYSELPPPKSALTLAPFNLAADWEEILAGAESDLADAIALTRDAEMNLRRCLEQEAQRRHTLESLRERLEAA